MTHLGETLKQRLELADYESLVERVASVIFDRAMEERRVFARDASRFRRTWAECPDNSKTAWRELAREKLA